MKIFGILNVTPDSFSDGDQYMPPERALKHIQDMCNQGADIIDIGAESTRPGAISLTPTEELNRLHPLLQSLSSEDDIVVSLDTRNYKTAIAALKFSQIKYLNDVSGFTDPCMVKLAVDTKINVVCMHSLTVPADKNIILQTPPVETILIWIQTKFTELTTAGIAPKQITFDPGLGFSKSAAQSLELINAAATLANLCHSLGAKILYGHSRKSFLGGGTIEERDWQTAKISNYLQKQRVDYIRVHNVKLNAQAISGESILK